MNIPKPCKTCTKYQQFGTSCYYFKKDKPTCWFNPVYEDVDYLIEWYQKHRGSLLSN